MQTCTLRYGFVGDRGKEEILVRPHTTNRRIIARCYDEVGSMSKISELAPPTSKIAAGTSYVPVLLQCIQIKTHSSCEIEDEDFVETHLCKLCVIPRSRVLRVVCPHSGYRSATPLGTTV